LFARPGPTLKGFRPRPGT